MKHSGLQEDGAAARLLVPMTFPTPSMAAARPA
jgi:hypothetical protein